MREPGRGDRGGGAHSQRPARVDRGSTDHGDPGGAGPVASADATVLVERLFRQESGRAVAALIKVLRDFDLAEEAVQEAFAVALERWPASGAPANPGAWITTTARNKAIDRLRRERRLEDKRRELERMARLDQAGDTAPAREEA